MSDEATRVRRDPTLQMGPVPAISDRQVSGNGLFGGKDRPPGLLHVPQVLLRSSTFTNPLHMETHRPGFCAQHEGSWAGKGRGVRAPAGPEGTALTLSEGRLRWCQEAGCGRAAKRL